MRAEGEAELVERERHRGVETSDRSARGSVPAIGSEAAAREGDSSRNRNTSRARELARPTSASRSAAAKVTVINVNELIYLGGIEAQLGIVWNRHVHHEALRPNVPPTPEPRIKAIAGLRLSYAKLME